MSQCRSCHAVIFWIETPNGRRAPFDPDGQSHFATCPDSRAWRRTEPPEPEPEQAALLDADDAPPKEPLGRRYWEV